MIILITGVAGFIGARTAELLLSEKHKVVGIDNLNDYYDVRIKEHRLSILKKDKNFNFLNEDIESHKALEKVFLKNNFDIVINLAARAGVRYSLENPFIYAQTNLIGSLNLLDLMRKFNVNKYIMASTSSIYAGSEMPYKEDLPVNNPISPYAASKKAAELMAFTYHHQFGIDVTILRYFTVFGPAGRPDMSILRFVKWIDEGKPILLYGDGSQARDFTYVDDIAKGTIKAAFTKTGYEIINLGGGNNPVSISKLISKIENFLNKKAIIDNKPFHNADVDSTWADISKASRILNWSPEVSLDEGLSATIDWYHLNKNWLSEIDFHDKKN
jgi:nucleoside-diphosphate-sugar epimerase